MVKRHYFGVIERASDGFGIYFPDFPGCVSGGDTLDEVVAMGSEALQFHIDGMVEDGDDIAEPSEIDLDRERAVTPEADLRALVAVAVTVPTFPEMIDVPIKSEIVREIAARVRENLGLSSPRQFIETAARNELDRLKKSA